MESLIFFCIGKDGKIRTTSFITSNINDDKYVMEQIRKEEFCNESDIYFLKPIVKKFKSLE